MCMGRSLPRRQQQAPFPFASTTFDSGAPQPGVVERSGSSSFGAPQPGVVERSGSSSSSASFGEAGGGRARGVRSSSLTGPGGRPLSRAGAAVLGGAAAPPQGRPPVAFTASATDPVPGMGAANVPVPPLGSTSRNRCVPNAPSLPQFSRAAPPGVRSADQSPHSRAASSFSASAPLTPADLTDASARETHAPEKMLQRRPQAVPRHYTKASEDALSQLGGIDAELRAIEARVSELTAALARGDANEHLGIVKTELAALEARAHKIETQGVDGVYTGDLHTGKVEAKELKKQMLARLETVFDVIDRTFKDIKAATTPNRDGQVVN